MLLPLIAALCACQPGWVRIDGGKLADDELQRARQVCQVDEKLAVLEQSRAANSIEATRTSSNEGRMLMIENFEQDNYASYLEIDECMRLQGFSRP